MSLVFWSFVAIVPLFLIALAFPYLISGWEEFSCALRRREWLALSDLAMRGSLWFLLVLASVLAIWAIYVAPLAMAFLGGTPNLWWAALILFPAGIVAALEWSKSDHGKTLVSFAGSWAFVGLMILRAIA